jgi:hypothetical protein
MLTSVPQAESSGNAVLETVKQLGQIGMGNIWAIYFGSI